MQDICVTATRDYNVYASFRPSIATKDTETSSKMNTAEMKDGSRKLYTVKPPLSVAKSLCRGNNESYHQSPSLTVKPLVIPQSFIMRFCSTEVYLNYMEDFVPKMKVFAVNFSPLCHLFNRH